MWSTIDTVEHIERWRQAAHYWGIQAGLCRDGRFFIFLGFFFCILAFMMGSDGFWVVPLVLAVPLVMIGLLRLLVAPRATISISYALLALGLLANTIIVAFELLSWDPEQATLSFPLVAIQFFGYGLLTFQLWNISRSVPQDVSAADVAAIDNLASGLRRVDARRTAGYIQFADSLKLYRETIKGKLSRHTALFLFQRKHLLLLVRKEEVHIVNVQSVPFHKELQAVFQVTESSLTVFMHPDALERFKQWKE